MKDWDQHYQEQLDLFISSGNLIMDETHAIMTTSLFKSLDEYSTSIPTGVFFGKIWKRMDPPYKLDAPWCLMQPNIPPVWLMGHYEKFPEDLNRAKIHWREILLL